MKLNTFTRLTVAAVAMFATAQTANAERWNRGVNARQENQQQRIQNGLQSGQLTGREAARLQQQQQDLAAREAQMRASGGGLSPAERERLQREQNALSRNIYRQEHDGQRIPGAPYAGQPVVSQPGYGRPGFGQSGFNQPGYGQPGFGQPGFGQPGYGHHHDHFPGQPGFGSGPNFTQGGQGINARQANQQARMQQGLQSGQLTNREYRRLEEKQARFAELEAQLRSSGGGLSPDERARLEFEQRQLSQDIERQKHDGQAR